MQIRRNPAGCVPATYTHASRFGSMSTSAIRCRHQCRRSGFLKRRTATAAELEAIATIGAPLNESEKHREEALRLGIRAWTSHRTK